MFTIILRKILNNRWMMLCLLIGSVLVVAMASSIPVYTNGVMQRMLSRDLEKYQEETGKFPGNYWISANFSLSFGEKNSGEILKLFDKKIKDNVVTDMNLPVLSQLYELTADYITLLPEIQRERKPAKKTVELKAFSELQDHMEIIKGRMYSYDEKDGVIETVVTEEAFKELDLRLDEIYVISDISEQLKEPLRVKVVGIFEIKDPRDPYWYQNYFRTQLFMDYNLFYRRIIEKNPSLLSNAGWYYAFDYHRITIADIDSILNIYKSHKVWFNEYAAVISNDMPIASIIEQYYFRENQLKLTLWVLIIPILVMLVFYIFMVSKLIIGNEENEIAVLKSRGASSAQVLRGYFLEGAVIGGIAFALGPLAGILICEVLGASNGFMEFVQRTALPIMIDFKMLIYAGGAFILFIATMSVPALLASRNTIVQYKQKTARNMKAPFWQKSFADIMILAAAGYGLYRYYGDQKAFAAAGVEMMEVGIDPLIFLLSTLFIFGAGLLFLRIFPYIIRVVFWMGRRIWNPVLYSTFINVGRSGGKEQFLMLFIIIALSIGIFNANAARTINANIEDKIVYNTGADITIMPLWISNKTSTLFNPSGMSSYGPSSGAAAKRSSKDDDEPTRYVEPPYESFTKLSGVEKATKVMRIDNAKAGITGKQIDNVHVMGIIPYEFGKVAEFRSDLLPYHWYEYLNLLSLAPKAFLASRSFEEKYDLKAGDSIYITWGKQGALEGKIYAFVDYWPTFNPKSKESGKDSPNLIVANLSYIQDKLALEPYEIWIKKQPQVSDSQVYNDLKKKDIKTTGIKYINQQLIQKKKDPLVQGTNGALTLGFIITMIITLIGFLIYWILSVQKRTLQFGIFRAMGLSVRKVTGMLVCEQILISGSAIVAGIIIGGMASQLFVPLFQMVYNTAEQVPPFKIVASRSDYVKIYMVITFMLTVGILILSRIVAQIKISQAIKLGED